MTDLTEIFCPRCEIKNYVNPRIYHEDPVSGETSPLTWHCTFCTEVIE